jgi:hypothetical protein
MEKLLCLDVLTVPPDMAYTQGRHHSRCPLQYTSASSNSFHQLLTRPACQTTIRSGWQPGRLSFPCVTVRIIYNTYTNKCIVVTPLVLRREWKLPSGCFTKWYWARAATYSPWENPSRHSNHPVGLPTKRNSGFDSLDDLSLARILVYLMDSVCRILSASHATMRHL